MGKKTKVLLINPYCNPGISTGKLQDFLVAMPPIGLAYLLAVLEKQGFAPLFYEDFLEKGNDHKLRKCLTEHRPQIVGMPLYTSPVINRVQSIVALIRKCVPKALIVLGNLHANVFAKELLQDKTADIIITGEGEVTLSELAEAIERGISWSRVQGIMFLDRQGKLVDTGPRALIEDLDPLPFPAWHLMPYQSYNIIDLGKIAATGTFILGSRGCPYGCDYCSLLIQGRQRRRRSPQNICDEIEQLIERYRIKSFHFIDPIFPIDKEEGMRFCEVMVQRNLHRKIIWGTETRVELVDRELLKNMYRAGCRRVMYGIESGVQRILDDMRKESKVAKISSAVEWSHKERLSPTGFFMIGNPGETKDDIERTIDYALRLKLSFAKFAVFVPYPGTPVYKKLIDSGAISSKEAKNWDRYTSYPTENNPPIYLNPLLGLPALLALQKKAHFKFYFRLRQLFILLGLFRYSGSTFVKLTKLVFKELGQSILTFCRNERRARYGVLEEQQNRYR